MNKILNFGIITTLFLTISIIAYAQDKKPSVQRAPANVLVDGKLTEWGDSLALYDAKSKLNYTIANDDTMLYVTAYITDKQMRRKIMAGGITISVNGEGKKHKTYSMTYPIPNKSVFMSRNSEESGDDAPRPSLIESTSIRVAGFKDVESEVITTANTYGFRASIGFDAQHNMVYETAIPLKMLYLKQGKKVINQLAINIAINGMQRPAGTENGQRRGGGMEGGGIGGGGGMGGMGGGGGGGGHRGGGGGRGGNHEGQSPDKSAASETTDFWVELVLPKH
jgi:hypothetical protein